MNFVDIAILLLLAITVLGGWYRGFVNTVCAIGALLCSWAVAMLCIPLVAAGVRGRASLFNMMLYYTEGAEYVAVTDVELTRVPISQVSVETLRTVIQNADMPIPMGRCVTKNIATEAFAEGGITTLGDYFNQTIVRVVINIFAFLLVFLLVWALLSLVVRGVDYARGGFPVLQRADGPLGACLGLIHGVLLIFVFFMAVPVALTVLPKIYEYLQESFFGEFFYKANFLLPLIPGT